MAPGTYADGRSTIEKIGEAVGGGGEALKEAPGNLARGLLTNLISAGAAPVDGGIATRVFQDGPVNQDRPLDVLLDGVNQGNPLLAVAIPVVDGVQGAEKGNFEQVGKAVVEGAIAGVMLGVTLKQVEQRAGLAPKARTQVHGNALASERAQHVYQILVNDANGPRVYKYGVSGGPVTKGGMSIRAALQVRYLNAFAKRGVSYEGSIVHRVPAGPGARSTALAIEKNLVYEEAARTRKPEGNLKP